MTTDRTSGRGWSGCQESRTDGCDRSRSSVAPYRSDETVERGITVTREIFRATVELAAARGAMPLILVPQFGPEDRVEQALRRRILDEPGLPYVLVEIDPAWRVPGDVHRTRAPRT